MYNKLTLVAERINQNIEHKGLYRFDRTDFKWNKEISLKNSKYHKIRPIILGMEEFFPYTLRKLWKIKPKPYPTTYTFIGNAYLIAEKNSLKLEKRMTSIDIMKKCLKQYLTIENGVPWWNYEEEVFAKIDPKSRHKRATMPMHCLARCNILLINIGLFYQKREWLKLAYDSAINTMKHHNMSKNGNKMSISYFYNSDDCVININSEFAMWLAMLQCFYKRSNEMANTLDCLLNMIIDEQRKDGSWTYNSRAYIERYGVSDDIDCHHTGSILYNLINIASYNVIDEGIQIKLIKTIDKGMEYFITTFFKKPMHVKTYSNRIRPAGPTQYSEAIFSFCNYLENEEIYNKNTVKRVKRVLPYALKKDISFINMKNGSAKSEKVIKWINIDSIRWGNGPVLEAIMRYLEFRKNKNEN